MENNLTAILSDLNNDKDGAIRRLEAYFATKMDKETLLNALRRCADSKALKEADESKFYGFVTRAIQRVKELIGDSTYATIISEINAVLKETSGTDSTGPFRNPRNPSGRLIAELALRRGCVYHVCQALVKAIDLTEG